MPILLQNTLMVLKFIKLTQMVPFLLKRQLDFFISNDTFHFSSKKLRWNRWSFLDEKWNIFIKLKKSGCLWEENYDQNDWESPETYTDSGQRVSDEAPDHNPVSFMCSSITHFDVSWCCQNSPVFCSKGLSSSFMPVAPLPPLLVLVFPLLDNEDSSLEWKDMRF